MLSNHDSTLSLPPPGVVLSNLIALPYTRCTATACVTGLDVSRCVKTSASSSSTVQLHLMCFYSQTFCMFSFSFMVQINAPDVNRWRGLGQLTTLNANCKLPPHGNPKNRGGVMLLHTHTQKQKTSSKVTIHNASL